MELQNNVFDFISGPLKYFSILDRENNPVFLINFSDLDKELDYQMMIFSSLDILEYKEIQKKNKQTSSRDDYLGLMMPFYENDYDLASYGFIGKNGFKFIALKKIEVSILEGASEKKMEEAFNEIHSKLVKLILNPFFDKKKFYDGNEKYESKEQFTKYVVSTFRDKFN